MSVFVAAAARTVVRPRCEFHQSAVRLRGVAHGHGAHFLSAVGHGERRCVVEGDDISKPEKVLGLLYAKGLKSIPNKRYIILNRRDKIDLDYYRTKLSVIFKVRAMENYCAVIVVAENMTKCYQCGMNRTAQVVRQVDGKFGIDLSRTGGPETIWRNKEGMRASWRDNIEWLINSMQ